MLVKILEMAFCSLIDGSNTLERTTAIEPEKQGSRSIEKHIKSITVKQQFTKNTQEN